MDTWEVEPYWQWWEAQMALIAQDLVPDPQRTAAVTEITQQLRADARGAHRQHLGALRHGVKHWRRRR